MYMRAYVRVQKRTNDIQFFCKSAKRKLEKDLLKNVLVSKPILAYKATFISKLIPR